MKSNCCKNKKLLKGTRQTVELLKVIAEENRLRILCILKNGEQCVCKIVENLGISQSLVSHHLKTLKDAELIKDDKRGLWVYYSLTEKGKRIANINFN
ncbi:MAG: metalloregulator ArsR/SmtB family transcription factor [Candidatus Pacebacteria bacterium]|nr:metalloregulator ArsR/SmtB family transcription factor [Candidatus Paceibacterota bacterium]